MNFSPKDYRSFPIGLTVTTATGYTAIHCFNNRPAFITSAAQGGGIKSSLQFPREYHSPVNRDFTQRISSYQCCILTTRYSAFLRIPRRPAQVLAGGGVAVQPWADLAEAPRLAGVMEQGFSVWRSPKGDFPHSFFYGNIREQREPFAGSVSRYCKDTTGGYPFFSGDSPPGPIISPAFLIRK